MSTSVLIRVCINKTDPWRPFSAIFAGATCAFIEVREGVRHVTLQGVAYILHYNETTTTLQQHARVELAMNPSTQSSLQPPTKHYASLIKRPSSARPSPLGVDTPSTIQEGELLHHKSPARRSWFQLDVLPAEWDILFLSTCLKLLLFPA